MVEQHYRWDFVGLSTDTKPTPATSEKVVDGSTFYCSDTSKLYVFCKDTWYERKSLGGGGGGTSYTAGNGIEIADDTISVDTDTIQPKFVTILTTADYDENNRIDITSLDAGWYLIKTGCEIYFNDSYTWELDCDNLLYKRINDIQLEDPTQIDYDAILYAIGVNLYSVSGEAGNEPDVYEQYFVTTEVTNNIAEQLHDAVLRGGATPTTSTEGKIGTLYENSSNGKLYICTAIDSTDPSDIQYTWTEVGAGGGGGTSMVKTLTSADYNYPTNNPTSVNAGMLNAGIYFISDDTVNVYDGNNTGTGKSNEVFIVSNTSGDATLQEMMVINSNNGAPSANYKIAFYYVDKTTGTASKRGGANGYGMLDGGYVVDNLASSDSKKVLSANMGKFLNDKINPTSGSSAPTTSTTGVLGKIYIDTTNDDAYMCVKIESGVYTWKKITA